MTLVNQLYDWLAQGPTPDCDRIFAAALRHAGEGWSERITRILLSRGGESAWAALIGHYEQLDPDVREQLLGDVESLHAGAAIAFKSSDPGVRFNALAALRERPAPRMAYLIAGAVRDPVARVRGLAGQVLRELADDFLRQELVESNLNAPSSRGAERRQVVLAVDESLRTFDFHHRIEVLEAALWFARDLGDSLWEILTSHRSRIGGVAAEQIYHWNSPRLAHFLVSSLKYAAWRQTAGRLLASWTTSTQLRALFAQVALLDDPEIRGNLHAIKNPKWFCDRVDVLEELPDELRRLTPRWVCHAGYNDKPKTELLARWIGANDPELHKAAVYALAEIDSPSARLLMQQVSESDSPLAQFARWCAVAFDTEVVRSALAPSNTRKKPSRAPQVVPPEENAASADCTMLWQACRRTDPKERGELIAALREHAEVWRPQLRAHLHSPDPRDRVLVLQIVSTEQLALRFRHDLEPLLSDPVEGIRHLAQTLVSAISHHPLAHKPLAATTEPRQPTEHDGEHDDARRALRGVLEQLSSGASDPMDHDLIAQTRQLLRDVYGEDGAPARPGQTVEEQS